MMPDEANGIGSRRGLRYDEPSDPDFQGKWLRARDLEWGEVELAFRHGFDASGRFADRPFQEVAEYLRESWEAMAPPAKWSNVSDIVRSGYELYQGAGFGASVDLTPEARTHFPQRTSGGSATGGVMGERTFAPTAEPVSDIAGAGEPSATGANEPPSTGEEESPGE